MKLIMRLALFVAVVTIVPALGAQPECDYTAAKIVNGVIKCSADPGGSCVTCPPID